MIKSLVFAVVFLGAALACTFGKERNLPVAVTGYVLSLSLFALWRFAREAEQQSMEFMLWISENQAAIKAGTASFHGMLITEQTELTQYHTAVSYGVESLMVCSRFYVVGQESSPVTALRFTACSLLLGWWGFPWGPVFTIRAIATNLQGGRRRKVAEVIADLSGHEQDVVQLTERAAENARRIMDERGFPAGSAMQVEPIGDPDSYQYRITYDDHPQSDGSAWRGQSHGVTVIVMKRDRPRLEGLLIDYVDGDYRFDSAKLVTAVREY